MLVGWFRRKAKGVRPKVIRHAGRRWEVLPGGEEIVRSRRDWSAAALSGEFGRSVLREKGDQRFVFRMTTPAYDVVVKAETPRRFKPRFRSFYGWTKARKEWENHLAAVDLGIPTVRPLALGEFRNPVLIHEALVITEWRPDTKTVYEWRVEQLARGNAAAVLHVAARLGRIAALTHEKGIYHKELFIGNVLIEGASDDPPIWVIDWKHAQLRRPTPADDVRNLLRTGWGFNYGMADNPPTDAEKQAFLAAYLGARSGGTDRAGLVAGLRRACPDAAWLDDAPGE